MKLPFASLLLALALLPSAALAQSPAAKPPDLLPVTNATGTVQLYCRLKWTATKIWVQVYNTGTEAALPGTTFTFRTLGPQNVDQTYVLERRVAPGRKLSVAKALPFTDPKNPPIWGCQPALPKTK